MNPISNISIPGPTILPGQGATPAGGTNGASFKDFLVDSIREVNSMQQEADRAVESLATGGDTTPAEVLTAVQKADIAFKLMIQVRNKMMDAYEEVKQIRV